MQRSDSVHGIAGAAGGLLLLAALAGLSGCGGSGGYAPGCYLNGAVRGDTRRDLEAAAGRLYGLLRSAHYEDAWVEASTQLRTTADKNQVMSAWSGLGEVLTIPRDLKTEEVAVVAIEKGSRGPQQVNCVDPGNAAGGRTMLATDQPLQAYLIQTADVGGTNYSFASVWFMEKGKWRVWMSGAKAHKLAGHDWNWYAGLARAQKAKGNQRNAALLYNLAMDLLVPAPWVRPDELADLTREQRGISVENLPHGRALSWVTPDSTEFKVYNAGCEAGEGGLAVHLWYEVPAPVDTAAVTRRMPKLAEFVRTMFPEYKETFQVVHLSATVAVTHEPVWDQIFPLAGGQ